MKSFCINCSGCKARLGGRGLFARFSDAGLKVLDNYATSRVYSAGQTLFSEGDAPEGLHCLHKGLVKLHRINTDGNPGFLRLAKPGYPLGYRAFFVTGIYSCSAVVMKDSEICYLTRASIAGLIESEPSLREALLKTLADDLADAEKNWLEAAQKTVQSRVCRLLLELESLETWPPRSEMALMLSIRPEVFARTLSALQNKGYIKRNRRNLLLTDHVALTALAEGE